MIADALTEEDKKAIEKLFDAHRLDAEMCQDFMYWMFQKAYAQMGREHQEWHSLKIMMRAPYVEGRKQVHFLISEINYIYKWTFYEHQ